MSFEEKNPQSGIRLPYTVPKFVSEPQLLKLGLFRAVYHVLLSSNLTTVINQLRNHLVSIIGKMNSINYRLRCCVYMQSVRLPRQSAAPTRKIIGQN